MISNALTGAEKRTLNGKMGFGIGRIEGFEDE
jgi:hypothetical protein